MTITEFGKRAEHQNGYDREFHNWKIIDIHQIPPEIMENHEYSMKEESMDLETLKEKSGLSNKKWDKGIKGLRKNGIVNVVKTEDNIVVQQIEA